MLGSSALPSPATATIHTATPTSPTRPSRLRGLSYLRSYTSSRGGGDTQLSPRLERSRSSPTHPTDTSPVPPLPTPRRQNTAETTATSAWLPTVQGRSGLSRDSLNPTSSHESASPEVAYMNSSNSASAGMTRNRGASTAQAGPTPTSTLSPPQSRTATLRRQPQPELEPSMTVTQETASTSNSNLPTIRFIPHIEPRSPRPSLHFTAITRTLPTLTTIVRVGRYSERDNNNPNAPVGFKSKVVSRRHCEFWCTNSQWYVKDVKSSSGTFLNHVRLSSPGVESRPFPINDGDVIQLGIDFKGGEEVIFRCVKIRIECNRGWQKGLNSFNTTTHQRLLQAQKPGAARDSDAASTNSSECSICLNPVAPCQALFVAPCSHVWHYKCVRNLINGPNYPNFLCPNCRFVADLEAEVEPPEDYEMEEAVIDETEEEDQQEGASRGREDSRLEDEDLELAEGIRGTSLSSPHDHTSTSRGGSRAVSIHRPTRQDSTDHDEDEELGSELLSARSATPTSSAPFALAAGVMSMRQEDERRGGGSRASERGDGPMTPRNEAGPFLLDGSTRREGFTA